VREARVEPRVREAPVMVAEEIVAPEETVAPEDPLTIENRLLANAIRAMNAGRYDEALSALDEHRAQYPNGVMALERDFARLRVLCRAGRTDEASRARAALLARGVAEARVDNACPQ
jgi:predicted Zn-dependent protease